MCDHLRLHIRALALISILLMVTANLGCQAPSGAPSDDEDGGSPDVPTFVADYSDYRIVALPAEAGEPGEWSFAVDAGDETIPSELRLVWDFGDGRTYEGGQQAFVFRSSGMYVVVVTAYDEDNAVAFVLTVDVEVSLPADAGPEALAGEDRTVSEGETVCLEGSAEPVADSLTYRWRQTEGPPVTLQSTNAPTRMCFDAPEVDGTVRLSFELEVDDGNHSSTDCVVVIVENTPEPAAVLVADAGEDQSAASGDLVVLDGSGSHGEGVEPLRFQWGQLEGPTASLTSSAPGIVTFVAPHVVGEAQSLRFRLTVTQGDASAVDEVIVSVRPADTGEGGAGGGGGGGEVSCTDNASCDDGMFCNGAEQCVGGACQPGTVPCAGQQCDEVLDACVECLGDADCDDGQFCNGAEQCVGGACQPGAAPCAGQQCDEALDACVECFGDADCDDGQFCNGAELCVVGACQPGAAPCAGQQCDEVLDACVECLGDADCDDGQFCNGPEVCTAGTCEWGGDPFLPGVAVGSVQQTDVVEASGLAGSRRNPGVLWTHDDSGGANVVFAINTAGRLLGTYQLGSGSLTDAEDIAVGPGPTPGVNYVYLGDIGDNSSTRSTIRIKRVPEPAVDVDQAYTSVTLSGVDIITLQYPSGADAPSHKDSEAMFVDTNGDIYLVTKRIYPNKLYRAPFPQSTSSTVTLEYVATLPTGAGLQWITGADCSPDGHWLIVTNDQGTDYANIWRREPGASVGEVMAGSPCPMVIQAEPQGEAIAWDAQGLGFYTLSEAHSASEPLWYYERNGDAD